MSVNVQAFGFSSSQENNTLFDGPWGRFLHVVTSMCVSFVLQVRWWQNSPWSEVWERWNERHWNWSPAGSADQTTHRWWENCSEVTLEVVRRNNGPCLWWWTFHCSAKKIEFYTHFTPEKVNMVLNKKKLDIFLLLSVLRSYSHTIAINGRQ